MLQEMEIARRSGGQLQLRPDGFRVRWEWNDLATADGHLVQAGFSCTARVLDNPTDRKMLEEALLAAKPTATAEDVVKYFAAGIRAAAVDFSRRVDAEDLLSPGRHEPFVQALMDSGRSIAFACGLELSPPAQLDLDSSTLRQARRGMLAAQQAKALAVEQAERLDQSAALFAKFKAIRESAPDLPVAQVLSQVGMGDKGELVRSLLLASAQDAPPQRLFSVAGPYLVEVVSGAANLIPLPPTLGPLRSVQAGADGSVWIGARSGIMRVDAAHPDNAIIYNDPAAVSPMGFNGVVQLGQKVWATHGEAGLVCWDLNAPDKPQRAFRPADAGVAAFSPRNLVVADGRLFLTSGNFLLSPGETGSLDQIDIPTRDELVAAISGGDSALLLVTSGGQLCTVSLEADALPRVQRRAGRISAAAPVSWLGQTRILLAAEDGPILCVSSEDEMVTQYASAYSALRIVAASVDRIAAVTSDRQRIILWNPWDGLKPAGEVHVASLAKHRIADVAFV